MKASRMLNFNPDHFLSVERGAVAAAADIEKAVATAMDAGVENIHFLGAGGAGILMGPAHLLLSRRSGMRTFLTQPAEAAVTTNTNLGRDSLVVLPSLSGTTLEIVEAGAYAREVGASIVALTGRADSPLASLSHHCVVNEADDETSSESFYIQSLLLALAVMRQRGEFGEWDRAVAELATLPDALLAAKEAFEPRAAQLAAQLAAHENYHIVTSAGASWSEAFYWSMCILEEMQWLRTRPVHAGDFFHGPLELVQKGVSVIIVKGEDEGARLTERVERFAPQVTDCVTVLNSADFPTPGLSADTREFVAHAIHATLLERLSSHIAAARCHPLAIRRYYRRLSY